MFSKTNNKLPKAVEFSLKPEDFMDDIESIANCEENRKMLYQCIDSKIPPVDSKLLKVEDFLKDKEVLQHVSEELHIKHNELKQLKEDLLKHLQEISNLLDDKMNTS